MRALDTNVLVRLMTRDDAKQARAADTFVKAGAWVSILALAEATWVLTSLYNRSSAQLIAALEMLLDHQSLVLQDSDVVLAAVDLFRSKPSLRFSDCLILEMARENGHLPLGTFDRELGKMHGAQRL